MEELEKKVKELQEELENADQTIADLREHIEEINHNAKSLFHLIDTTL